MRAASMKTILSVVCAVTAMTFASPTSANRLDLTLANFIECPANGVGCTADHADFETFLAEYLFGIAPKVLAPAETLGYSGFYMGVEGSMAIRPLGNDAEDRWQRGTASNEVQTVMWNPGVHIRKGFPHFFGQPWSIEMGSTVSYLALSELVTLGGEIKVSFFEGYHSGWRGALPDISARGSLVRVIGESDVDLTMVSVDGSLSYSFGLAGVVNLTPYGGYQLTMSIVHMEPLLFYDGNQYHSQNTVTVNNVSTQYWETTLLDNPFLMRHHAFFGLRLGYELIAFTVELEWGLPRKWDTKANSNLQAEVGNQIKISSGLGVDF
jgi:hypothetical protein